MEGNKLEISVKQNDSAATYKPIAETDMEEEAIKRPKNVVIKIKTTTPEIDGADEKMLPKNEQIDLKVVNNEKQNGDAKLDIGELKSAFVGITKEELMKYANDPFWVRLRWFLFISFWLLWALMLVGAILIICAAPKCDPPPPRTWWQRGPLAEITEELKPEDVKKLKEKGVTGVIVQWPDDAYSIFDETHNFINTLKNYIDENVRVIIELQPGSSLSWFNKSEARDDEFSDYYIWKQPQITSAGDYLPPNNWRNVNNNSSWIFSEKRNEYYYAPFGQPLLNFRNSNVTARFSNVLRKFLAHGVSGVRLKDAPHLLVSAKFEDEIVNNQQKDGSVLTDYTFYAHTKTAHLLDLGPLLKEWREVVKNATEGPFMVTNELRNIEAYKVNGTFVVDLPLQSRVFTNLNVTNIVNVLNGTFKADNIEWPLWQANASDVVDVVAYLLPGTPLVEQGANVSAALLKVRDSPSIMRGKCDLYALNNGSVFAFLRVTPGNPGILVALNPTENLINVDFPATIKDVSEEVTVVLRSSSYNDTFVPINVKQDAHNIPLLPKSAIVLSYVPLKKE